jgi:hypothetical protein
MSAAQILLTFISPGLVLANNALSSEATSSDA